VKVAGLRDTEVRYVRADMEPVTTSIRLVDVESVLRGRPVRRVRSYAGQRHYSGLFWSATTGGHVSYESRLELDRQLLADFDQDVAWMASQPMWLSGRDGSAVRRHVPDLLMRLRNGEYLVSDVKPAKFAALPEVAAVLEWTGRVCRERGWRYEVWSGADACRLNNVRFIAAGRRVEFVDQRVVAVLKNVVRDGTTVGEACALAERSGAPGTAIKPALLSMIWLGEWSVDLMRPLSSETVIHAPVEEQ
jgi:hypothetical protein